MQPKSDHFSDEDLIGYLLNGLSDEDYLRVEKALAADPILRQRLEDLSELLVPMEDLKGRSTNPNIPLSNGRWN